MKNIILIINFLFCTVSIVYAQKQPFLKDSWKGDMTSVKQEKGRLKIASVAVPEICWHLDAFSKKVSMYRNVQLNDVNRTVWCSFLALKEKGNSRLGLSIEKSNSEKLFVEVKQTQEPQLVVVRIDFSEKADKAYVFYSPTAASVPDLENAEYTLSGKFDFDCISLHYS